MRTMCCVSSVGRTRLADQTNPFLDSTLERDIGLVEQVALLVRRAVDTPSAKISPTRGDSIPAEQLIAWDRVGRLEHGRNAAKQCA